MIIHTKKKLKKLKKNDVEEKKPDSSTERITDFFFIVQFMRMSLMCLSYCDDDVVHRIVTWKKVYEPQYIYKTYTTL